MELSMKQKIMVFGIMLVIFVGSVFLKQWINSGYEFGSSASNGEPISAVQQDGVKENGKDKGGAEINAENEMGENGVLGEDVIVVDVEGAVTLPGVVKIGYGSRVYQAIEKAGGLLDTADTRYVNLAEEVADGSIIYIPFKGEDGAAEGEGMAEPGSDLNSEGGNSGLININSADKSSLMELPGIGEAYADAIIEYRSTSGRFTKPEDIMNVSGIGEAKFKKLEGLICVY